MALRLQYSSQITRSGGFNQSGKMQHDAACFEDVRWDMRKCVLKHAQVWHMQLYSSNNFVAGLHVSAAVLRFSAVHLYIYIYIVLRFSAADLRFSAAVLRFSAVVRIRCRLTGQLFEASSAISSSRGPQITVSHSQMMDDRWMIDGWSG